MKNDDGEDMAIRLVEERVRLGYSQADFASKLGISREGLRKYEVGASRISANFLREAATLGLDVQYVVTGERVLRAAEPAAPVEAPPPAAAVVVHGGAGNVVGTVQSGATIHQIHTQRHITRTVAEVKPGDEHISEEQAATLLGLVNEVVRMEELARREPKTHRAVWSALNAHCRVTKYRLIRAEDFEKARKYLQQWIARLSRTATGTRADPSGFRRRSSAYIKINTRGREDALLAYLAKQFGVSSISELDDSQLERVYAWVAASRSKTLR